MSPVAASVGFHAGVTDDSRPFRSLLADGLRESSGRSGMGIGSQRCEPLLRIGSRKGLHQRAMQALRDFGRSGCGREDTVPGGDFVARQLFRDGRDIRQQGQPFFTGDAERFQFAALHVRQRR